jgi:serine/threonine protein phosphatase 1
MVQFREIPEHRDRFYAVGDIHGCLPELEVLLQFLALSEKLATRDIVVFIGDYIDRGPDSKGVVELLLKFKAQYPLAIFLRGNHEDMLLSYLGKGGRDGGAYLLNGGAECLESYGLNPRLLTNPAGEDVIKAIPQTHLDFFLKLENYVIAPDCTCAHAGLNPLRDMRHQVESDLFWIRDEFIQNKHFFDRPIVFGHTPYEDVMFNFPYKVGIDTGCVYGNKLSCVEFRDRKVIQVGRGSTKVVSKPFPKK